MREQPIGVFDSGVGGLTALKELRLTLPKEDIVYFGDTGRVPYGTRSKETIIKYAKQDIRFLLCHEVKMIIVACGTVSSVVPHETFVGIAGDIPVVEVVTPAVMAVKGDNNIGIIATNATISNGAYEKKIKAENPQARTVSIACPLFVPLVENGFTNRDNQITILTAKHYLQSIKEENIDSLILGCTHFPLISEIIGDIMGSGVKLINTGEKAAQYAKRVLEEKDILSERERDGECVYYVSDSVQSFIDVAQKIVPSSHYNAHKIDIEKY